MAIFPPLLFKVLLIHCDPHNEVLFYEKLIEIIKFLLLSQYKWFNHVTALSFNILYWSSSPNLQYARFVKPSFEEFILPTKKYADIIIPRGADNDVAIDLIVQHICTKLGQHDLCKIYSNVFVIFSTFQVLHLQFTYSRYFLYAQRTFFCRGYTNLIGYLLKE